METTVKLCWVKLFSAGFGWKLPDSFWKPVIAGYEFPKPGSALNTQHMLTLQFILLKSRDQNHRSGIDLRFTIYKPTTYKSRLIVTVQENGTKDIRKWIQFLHNHTATNILWPIPQDSVLFPTLCPEFLKNLIHDLAQAAQFICWWPCIVVCRIFIIKK